MIYGYVRVSTDKQSTENQRFEIENYSKAKGFRIERWVDETISGMQVRLSGKENVIKKMINEKCSMNEIAEKFGVNRQTLRDFLRNTFPDWRKYRYIK